MVTREQCGMFVLTQPRTLWDISWVDQSGLEPVQRKSEDRGQSENRVCSNLRIGPVV